MEGMRHLDEIRDNIRLPTTWWCAKYVTVDDRNMIEYFAYHMYSLKKRCHSKSDKRNANWEIQTLR